jgi:hypothetical protein
MRRPLLLLLLVGLLRGQAACKGQEVTVFETPPRGGSAGQAGTGGEATAGAGFPATAGAVSGGEAGMGVGGASGAAEDGGMAGTDAGGMAGGAGMPAGTPCTVDTECSGWRCEKAGCDAPSGVCEPWPVFVPAKPSPVCGCDGVMYWNDELRRQSGATLLAPGECRALARTCEVGADCGVSGASCSHLVGLGEMCGHGTGTCWVLPASCEPAGDGPLWRECTPEPPACVDTCQAIRSERPHVPAYYGGCR